MSTDLDTDAASAHRLFESYDGMEGLAGDRVETAVAASAGPTRLARWQSLFIRVYPGMLAAGTVALAATWLSQQYKAPVMLFALLIGMAFHFLHEEGRCVAGIEVSSKTILRIGVALLGARITLSQIMGLGWMPIVTVVAGVTTTIGLGVVASKMLGLKRTFGILSGGAVGICGASAALAIASVLPKDDDAERDTILAVVLVTALSTLAMILYPILAVSLGLTHVQSGVFLGGTIHDVAQVVGAGFSISPQTGNVATYVKLLRVSMLLPVVFTIAFLMQRGAGGGVGRAKAPIPMFLIGFAALVAINSLGWLPKVAVSGALVLSNWCLVMAISALGMKTSFKSLVTAGWRPVGLMVAETLWIGALVLSAVLIARPG
jgi:uncharacterized integral membrane protein (TIGR00698 family)